MKTEICVFSGMKIHPGHGIRYVPCISVQSTRPVFAFVNRKSERLFLRKRNPRKIRWTQLYRRAHKKGTGVEAAQKRARRRVQKVERAIVGAPLAFIKAKREMTDEQRLPLL